ncbi:MAG TPA: S9 family peptidase [Anaeromyxobacteraceae bacterium]|nr:S9 family peptidase [Anaeromyxobacteraceae bacterium]
MPISRRSSAPPRPALAAVLASVAALAAAASPPRAVAAEVPPTPPTAVDVASIPDVSGVSIRPDGAQVLFALRTKRFDPAARPGPDFDPARPSESDLKAGWTVETQLHVVPAAGGEARQLTFAPEGASRPTWSPDGGTVAFLRKKGPGVRIHLLALAGGEARVLDTGALEPQDFAFSPDGRRIAFTATLPPTDGERRQKWSSGGTIRWGREHASAVLHVVDLEGGKPVAVTGPAVHVTAFEWSPDGKRFAAFLAPSSDPYDASSMQRPAILVPREGGPAEPRWLEDSTAHVGAIRWSPDGKFVAYDLGAGTLSLLNHLVVREADGPGRWNAARALDPTLGGFAWTGDGALVALVADGVRSRFVRLARDGSSVRDVGFAGRVARGPLSADRSGARLAFVSSTPLDPWSPTVLDVRTGKDAVVFHPFPAAAGWPAMETEVVSWKSPEGAVVEGILTLPPGLRKGQKPPLWVFPHGGPDDVSQLSFSSWVRFFAARGFAVLRPNYRGSLGYGMDFYAANRGRLGEIEFQDIESGVDMLVATGRVDPDRLYYGSWSWGGYLTAWTIGHTTRYRAAVAGAAVADVVSQYVLSDINHGVSAQWEFRGDPWRQPEQFDRANPARHFHAARTPTLVLHGQADDRVPFPVGLFLYRALTDVGCEVELLAYPREPHGFREPAHVVHMLDAFAAWFTR